MVTHETNKKDLVGEEQELLRYISALRGTAAQDEGEHAPLAGGAGVGGGLAATETSYSTGKSDTALFRTIFEEGPLGMVLVAPDYRVLKANVLFCRMVGYTGAELTRLTLADITHPDDIDGDLALFQRVFAGEIPSFRTEKRYVRKDGGILWGRLTASAIHDTSGMQQYVLGMIEDISGRKEAETRYKDAPIGLCTLDTNLRYVHVNEVLAQVNGLSVEEHLGRTIREVVSDVGAGVEQQLRRVIDTGEPILGGTVEAETPAHPGVKRHFRHDYYPNRSDDGAITGVGCIVQEFTELKRAKEQLHEYERQLRTLASEISLAEERERRRIAAELHDRIGQSLALSRIKLGALREAVAAGGPVRDLDEVCGIVDRTIQDTRSLVCELSPPLLYELGLEAALEWLGERTSEQFGYTCEVQDDRRPKPLDDDVAVVLFQAVRELLFNAGKHARASRVQVTLSADGPTIKVEVEDDGIGFDASLIKVHSSNGIGFGLFSIRERLVHLGGRVAIWSAPGSGARITLHAPLRTEEA